MEELAGVFAPIVTPFRAGGTTIDFAWLPYLLSYLEAHGLDGVVPMGTTGEGPSLSPDERKALLDTVMARRGRLRVIAGVGTPSLALTIELTQHAFASGVDSVLVLPPYYWRNVSDEGLVTYFRTLCDKAVKPGQKIMLYHIPHISGVPITLNMLDALMETHGDCILGLKDSSGNPRSALEFMRRYPTLKVFIGSDDLAGFAYEMGAAGTISLAANVVPDKLQALRHLAQSGKDYTQAQEELSALRALLVEFGPVQASLKVLLSKILNTPLTFVRPPLLNLSAEQQFGLLARARELPILKDRNL